MLRSSILVLLCLSGVYSAAEKKEPAEKETEAAKSKRFATHQTPCPPEHQHSQTWQPETKVSWSMSPLKVQFIDRPTSNLYISSVQKQIITYVKPQSSGWQQSHSSGWQQQKWQPQSSGWLQPSTGWQQQQKWQPQLSGWQVNMWQPQSFGWQQQMVKPQISGWQQQKWQPQSSGWQLHQKWQPQSTGWQQQKWQPQSSGWQQQKVQPQATVWKPQSSGWQVQSSGWQPQSSGWQQQKWQSQPQPKILIQKPTFSYAPQYNHPMVHQSWTPSAKPSCPSPCGPSQKTIHYAPLPQTHQIKIPQIKYIKPQIHQPVYLPPPTQNKIWEEPCD